jgi:hypothetical protein
MEEQTPEQLLVSIAKALDKLGIEYYVTGGFAVSVWGRPRFTADIDLIVKMAKANKTGLAKELLKISPKGYIDEEQIESALARSGEFNFIDPETGIKVDFWIMKNNEFERNCLKNTKKQDIGYKVKFISPEDLIISKLIWYKQAGSTRHLEDIESVLKISKVQLKHIEEWAAKLDLERELGELDFNS